MHATWEYALLLGTIAFSCCTLAVALWRWVVRHFGPPPTLAEIAKAFTPTYAHMAIDHAFQKNPILDDLPWKDEKLDASTFRAEALAVDPTDEVALGKFLERWRGRVPRREFPRMVAPFRGRTGGVLKPRRGHMFWFHPAPDRERHLLVGYEYRTRPCAHGVKSDWGPVRLIGDDGFLFNDSDGDIEYEVIYTPTPTPTPTAIDFRYLPPMARLQPHAIPVDATSWRSRHGSDGWGSWQPITADMRERGLINSEAVGGYVEIGK